MASLQLQASINAGGKVKIVCGYALQQRLGSGSFATVYKGVKVRQTPPPTEGNTSSPSSSNAALPTTTPPAASPTTDVAAIKAITRTSEKLTKKVLENLEMEIAILRTYRHPNIVCMYEVQKTERHFYLILEYCGGGDVQRLIRTRRSGRLTERLTRRLMRDLSAGLKFLWSQELIHRDIKPQNLLLTGPLPLDEVNDPAKMAIHDEMRQTANFPSSQFALKIADFGFARHLQTQSLAETLCGSPLYMAPEILQHHRYDAKADLWSVGTVLFEMIAGKPPFNGENHIDLLRNIQRKAVRLPTDVKVSKECVQLLRILLNRNPLSRAGFKQFFEASDAFVGLGCEGKKIETEQQQRDQQSSTMKMMDLGTIHEQGANAASLMTVATTAETHKPLQQQQQSQHQLQQTSRPHDVTNQALATTSQMAVQQPQLQHGFATPPLGPLPTPEPFKRISPLGQQLVSPQQQQQQTMQQYNQPTFTTTATGTTATINPRFAPLQPSPPQSANIHRYIPPGGKVVLTSPLVPNLDASNNRGQIQLSTFPSRRTYSPQRPGETASQSSSRSSGRSSDDSEFVMVEHQQQQQHQQQQRYGGRSGTTGILSTSPGTGGMLVGLMNLGSRSPRLMNPMNRKSSSSNNNNSIVTSPANISIDSEIESATNMIAASEDVGRRAISVAHLGDTRAYLSMRHLGNLSANSNSNTSSFLTAAMEGVEEEEEHKDGDDIVATISEDERSSSKSIGSGGGRRRRLSSASERMFMMESEEKEEEEEEEMPFAMPAMDDESSGSKQNKISSVMPSRPGSESYYYKKSSAVVPSSSPHLVRICLHEALSCYLKALSMIKSVLTAVQKARSDMEALTKMQGISNNSRMTPERAHRIDFLMKRCSMTGRWLSGQFSGVLERADAANVEINKISNSMTIEMTVNKATEPRSSSPSSTTMNPAAANNNNVPAADNDNAKSVNELIYDHALACGRDASVKQLLGQYDTSRINYRTAGLLMESLLMEPNLEKDDKSILEEYVNAFSTRIQKLDTLMTTAGDTNKEENRVGGGVIGIIGGGGNSNIPPVLPPIPPPPPIGFAIENNNLSSTTTAAQ